MDKHEEDVVTSTVESVINASTNATMKFTTEESIMAYSGLYLMALFCIFVGSRRSVAFVRRSIVEHKPIENSLTSREAKMFPFTASAVLFGLYLFFKYGERVGEGRQYAISFIHNTTGLLGRFVTATASNSSIDSATLNSTSIGALMAQLPAVNKANVMFLLLVLICVEGCAALAQLMKPAVTFILSRLPGLSSNSQLKNALQYQMRFTRTKSKDSKELIDYFNLEFDTHDLISLVLFSSVGIAHVMYRHWITNDIIGVAFSLYGIEMLHLSSFKDGCMMLAGLFVYDIFWVFATDVMTTVATGINAPILLMFPQDLMRHGPLAASKHSMLGLGDIVIPGIFLALLLRFDRRVSETTSLRDGKVRQQQSGGDQKMRMYFAVTLCAYAAGLVLTIGVMHWFKAAQPALLYLVPACIGAPLLLAVCRGEVSTLFNYSEKQFVKQDDNDEKEKKKNN